jgi:hypothetical protein
MNAPWSKFVLTICFLVTLILDVGLIVISLELSDMLFPFL